MLAAIADLLSLVSLELITPQIMLPAPWALKGPLPGGQPCSHSVSWLPEKLDLGGGQRVYGHWQQRLPRAHKNGVGEMKSIKESVPTELPVIASSLASFTQALES